MVGRTAIFIKGVVIGRNPNIGLVAKAKANRRRTDRGGLRCRRGERCHNIGQDVGKAQVVATPQVLSWVVSVLVEKVAINRMGIEFRVAWRLPLGIIGVRCVQGGSRI